MMFSDSFVLLGGSVRFSALWGFRCLNDILTHRIRIVDKIRRICCLVRIVMQGLIA